MTVSFPTPPAPPRLPRVRWEHVSSDERQSWAAEKAPRVPWNKFTRDVFQPKPGEHVGIIGPTGQGKTVLQNAILPEFPFVAVFATKPADKTMDRLITHGSYIRLDRWRSLSAMDSPRRVIWPDASTMDAVENQKTRFHHAFESIFREGGRPKDNPVGWAIAIDEMWYFTNMLQLGRDIKLILLQGRSLGVTLIAATQRPAWIPVEVYDQSTHLFFFRDTDERSLSRIAEINHSDKAQIRSTVANLESHQVLYVNTRTGRMARTRTPPPEG